MNLKQILPIFIFILCSAQAKAQGKINTSLKHELDSMYMLDQKYRILVSEKMDSARVDSLTKLYHVSKGDLSQHLWKLQTDADSTNIRRIEQIIAQYGYPGSSMVGAPTNEATFYIIQHSKVIDKYLALVEKAAKDKQLPFHLYAMMKDRSLMYNKKEQIWGTQARGMTIVNKETKKAEFKFFIWPIADALNVNKRRKEAGFKDTVEENAKRLGINYKVYTLQQALDGAID